MLNDMVIKQLIEDAMTSIWESQIKDDYECGWLLKEDTLKNAIYYHLRTRLGWLFDENDIRIFTEFTDWKFKDHGFRPDMVIAKVDLNNKTCYWGNAVEECLAVIEIKYKAGFASHEKIYEDYKKLKCYSENLGINCKMYMVTIWECEDEPTSWVENAQWCVGELTELNASYKIGKDKEMQFYVIAH